MNNHLSQDQLSMWILGRSTPEERRHGAECPECRAELVRFEEPVTTFKNAMHEWSDSEPIPRLEQVSIFLRRPAAYMRGGLRWAAVAIAVTVLAAFPIYRQIETLTQRAASTETERPNAAETSDILLMDAVSAHLSRTIPAPMEPIMALIRDSDSKTDAGGTQQ